MSTDENKEFVHKYFAALSGKPKPPEVVDQFVDEQPLKDHVVETEVAFPEYTLEVLDMIAEGDQVAVKARVTGKHQGVLSGIPATGRNLDQTFHITYRIQNGKIVDHWMVMDYLSVMQQLGVIPQQA